MKRFAFIALHAPGWPVRAQCLLGVSPSGYYAWRKRVLVAAAEQPLPAWQVAAQRVFATHAGRYGQRRLRAQLRREGHAMGCAIGLVPAAYGPSVPGSVPGRRAPRRLTRRPWQPLTN